MIIQHSTSNIQQSAVDVLVRAARDDDVPVITAIVADFARQGHLLPRDADNIRASLRQWMLAEVDGRVVGIGSLFPMDSGLIEIRSIAVLQEYRSFGVGAAIVQALADEAQRRGYASVFALTRAVPFFERLGFEVTLKDFFPEKVWRDCVICPLYHACDETAVVKVFG